jgi:predicted flap endonuclease-1-like 5' DNA nuclease
MTNPVHLLSVAALLLVAFLVGGVIGSVARMIALRQQQKPSSAPAAKAEVVPTAAPLVAAPVIAPLPVAAAPLVPQPTQIPVPDFAATLIALADEKAPAGFLAPTGPAPAPAAPVSPPTATPEVPGVAPSATATEPMQPAHVAGETTSGVQVAAPRHDAPLVPAEPVETISQRSAEVIPFPSHPVEPPPASGPTDIVVGGETVVIVDASDLASAEPVVAIPVEKEAEPSPHAPNEDRFVFVSTDEPSEVVPALVTKPTSDTIPIPAFTASAPVGAVLAASLPVPEVVSSAPVVQNLPVSEDAAVEEPETTVVAEPIAPPAADNSAEPAAVEAISAPEPQVEPMPAAVAEPLDEDAAMRAIEGNWSPRRTPPKRVAAEGANQAVAASARAVTAARRTAEAVVAESKVVVAEANAEAGRPVGLDAPRDGRKDELTHIIGVLPVIETAFNKLGIYHFDQVGALTDENIGWIEGHLGVPGRIARELWREQARELSAVLRPRRAAEK